MRRSKQLGPWRTLTSFITVPLSFLKDYTIPMADDEKWDKIRHSIVPLTFIFSFMWLGEMFNEAEDARENYIICLLCLIPGLALAVFIQCKTQRDQAPSWLRTCFALVSFI